MPTTFLLLPPLEFDGGKLLDAVVPLVTPCLPTDILLEIFLRTDPVTLVRCAATSKDHLRRVADPAFLRRYGHHLDSRFVPSLLLGLYCVDDDDDDEDDDDLVRITVPPGPEPSARLCRSLAEDTVSTLTDWNYTPVAACGGLLFAKDLYTSPNLVKGRVIHTSRPQRYTSIPPADIGYASLLLLPDDHEEDNGLVSFQLVAVAVNMSQTQSHIRLLAQIFQSRSGKWVWFPSSPMEVSLPGGSPCTWFDTDAAVLRTDAGAAANWLCKSDVSYHAVSLNIHNAQAQVGVIELPPSCRDPRRDSNELLLAPSADRKQLTLLVTEGLKISVWIWTRATNSTATSCGWARQLVIDVLGVAGELSQRWPLPRPVDSEARVKFERWFGESSGTTVLEIDRCGHFALNLATKKLQLLKEFSETGNMWLLCGHEINPFPLLRKLQFLNIA